MLKMKMTPFDVGLKETYRWYVRSRRLRSASFELDDRLLGRARAGSPAAV